MNRKGSLIKNIGILSIGTIFPKFITILVTPILTAQLTKSEYGQYDLLITIVSLLFPILTLQISSAAFRFLIENKADFFMCKKIVSTIYFFVCMTFICTSAIYFLFKNRSIDSFLICGYLGVDILLITTQQIIRGLGHNLIYSISTVIRSVIDVLLVALLTGVFGTPNFGLSGVIGAMFSSTLLAFIYLFFAGGVYGYFSLDCIEPSTLKKMLRYSWPMVPNNLSGWVLRLSDRLVITAVLGTEANAVYAVANKMPTIFSSFQSTFSMAWQENASIASKDSDKDEYYSEMCDWIYSLLIGLMSVLIMSTPIIWNLLIKGNYQEAYEQVPMLYIGIMFSCFSSTLGGIYIAHMKTKNVGITTTLAAVINLILDIMLVRVIGIWAGSFSTMISYLWLVLYRMRDIQKFQKVHFKLKKMLLGLCMLSIMAILNYQEKIGCDILNVLMCIGVLYIFDRKIIFTILCAIRKKIYKKRV